MPSLSFTGTRKGMNTAQRVNLEAFLLSNEWDFVFHGAAKGADTQFHDLVCDLRPVPRIVIYPSTHEQNNLDNLWGLIAPVGPGLHTCIDEDGVEISFDVHPRAEPLLRNKWIVEPGDLLLATPFEVAEIPRSGTWAAIRYARKIGRKPILFLPDGRVTEG